jgi:hypothetical protein
MHIERLGTTEVQNIEIGTCYVFPKIDGTNASIWPSDMGLQSGSRSRWLAEGQNDNAGFRAALKDDPQFDGIRTAMIENSNLRFYGEWLVPHTLKTYRADAWKKFYVFDVMVETETGERYLPYEEYKVICDKYNINYIPCISIIKNGVYDDFVHILQQNNYLIADGQGMGEGIVIKNYNFVNQYGRVTWAKIVTSEFKEKHYKEMGAPERENKLVEETIINDFCTQTLIDKTYAKIINETGTWSSKMISRLFETVYHDLINEEMYTILKQLNSPTINFKTLRCFVIQRIKILKPEIF